MIPAAGRGDTAGKRPWLFENVLTDTVTDYDARNEILPHLLAFGPSRGDTDSGGRREAAVDRCLALADETEREHYLATEVRRLRRALDGA